MSSVTISGWVKLRKPISSYPKTPQQISVSVGGELIKRLCTGKKGEKFKSCRTEVLKCAFNDQECEKQLLALKKEILEEVKPRDEVRSS